MFDFICYIYIYTVTIYILLLHHGIYLIYLIWPTSYDFTFTYNEPMIFPIMAAGGFRDFSSQMQEGFCNFQEDSSMTFAMSVAEGKNCLCRCTSSEIS